MILTPKNWKSFQHYKDRSPSWIKLHKALLDDFEFACLPTASKALAPLLWLLASEYDDGRISGSLDKIAFRLHMTRGDLADALSPLLEKGFFEASEALAEPEQNACLEKDTYTREEGEIDSRSVASATRPCDDRFEEFWKVYPKREGPNPRKPAEQRFRALVKTGIDPAFLIDEVRKFAALDETRRQTGSRFIPQAVTWLNQQRWSDHAAVAFLADDLPREMSIECALSQFARIGSWSRFAPGAAPGEPGCVATAEQLAAAGLDANGRKLPSSEAA